MKMRLIDEDVLVRESLNILTWLMERQEQGISTTLGELHEKWIDAVRKAPTAYDPDKIVVQLEKLQKAEQDRPDNCDENGFGDGEQIYDDGRSQGRFEAFGEAIKIVKGGGVDAF